MFYIQGLSQEITDRVRATRQSPGYGHPIYEETASATGPCRACLQPFRVGEESRLLFTYRPPAGQDTVTAPGPVFIHATACEQYQGHSFPDGLADFSLLLEGWAADNILPIAKRTTGRDAGLVLAEIFANPAVEYVYVRHGEAGCHIARVDRASLG